MKKDRQGYFNLSNQSSPIFHLGICLGLFVIIYWVYAASLNNQFTNWDDITYIKANTLIKDVSFQGIKSIFTIPVIGNYHPFTILSYAIEYQFVQLEPWLYHFDNLILHILVTISVYVLTLMLCKNTSSAVLVALLFGLHPMHVESVSWVSGRKDVLCCLFYMGSCICYNMYLQKNKKIFYCLCVLFFVFSLLSKAVAVTLPVCLILIDYIKDRKWHLKLLFEKLPFFILAIIFGVIAINCQNQFNAINVKAINFNFFEHLVLACYALFLYVLKLFVPLNLACLYTYPAQINGNLPALYYLYFVAIVFLAFLYVKYAFKHRIFVFCMLFFLINIGLVLQVIPVGEAFIADRYSYIAYFGLFFMLVSFLMQWLQQVHSVLRNIVFISLFFYLSFLGFQSYGRALIWYDSVSLWRDEIGNVSPPSQTAYDNLGAAYFDLWYYASAKYSRKIYYDSAVYFLSEDQKKWPKNLNPCEPLAMLYASKKKYDTACYYLKIPLYMNPTAEGFLNYGNFLLSIGRNDSAIQAYSQSITLNPDLQAAYINRGKLYKKNSKWDEALSDFSSVIALNPQFGEAYYQRSFCDTQKGLKNMAYRDLQIALRLGYNRIDTNYIKYLSK